MSLTKTIRVEQEDYVSLKPLDKIKAHYNMIIGERSNGKTYAVLNRALERYFKEGSQLAVVRRNVTDFKGKNGRQLFDNLVADGLVSAYSGGEWDRIDYFSGQWFVAKCVDGKIIRDTTPFAHSFALISYVHDKSSSYPHVGTILFDEFLTRDTYLNDEFVIWQNVISTIVRHRDDVEIYMCGNTVNVWSPYYDEMGLTHIREQKKGDIDVYKYGESGLTVAVYYSDSPPKKLKKSSVYFAFDNPKLRMITDGDWEMDVYPHNPMPWENGDIVASFHILWDKYKLRGDVIEKDDCIFTFIHPCKIIDKELTIYTPEYNPLPNYRRNMLKPVTKLDYLVCDHIKHDKIYYRTNLTGEIVRNYINWCKKA